MTLVERHKKDVVESPDKVTTSTTEDGIIYFTNFREMESIGKHFFLDINFELISCPSLVDDGYDTSGMEYVEDWIINELTTEQQEELFQVVRKLKQLVSYRLERLGSGKLIQSLIESFTKKEIVVHRIMGRLAKKDRGQ
tara:strand:+ start:329 stop:745 length:417 start_codon:yes stop_codon:yes gene_type:complete